jgi:pyruvate-ferredoxin/flavodoxin oxidoreductase
MVCPHACIRLKAYKPELLKKAPATFKSADARGKEFDGMKATLQVAPEDCTGCGACINICPVKSKTEKAGRPSTSLTRSPSGRRKSRTGTSSCPSPRLPA